MKHYVDNGNLFGYATLLDYKNTDQMANALSTQAQQRKIPRGGSRFNFH